MDYSEAIAALYQLRLFGVKLGLDNVLRLSNLAGSPHTRLRFIHVAGTNGKGSTCAMLESIYRQAGYKVGLFTSPHLVRFNERIQVNREPISEDAVVRLWQEIEGHSRHLPADHHPTFFEVVVVMGLRHFKNNQCDLVIWETGMGGRLDATNIVTPLASLITNVQFDHQKWLGMTHAEIAREKAGIIKPSVPVLTAADDPEAVRVIQSQADRLKAPVHRVDSDRNALDAADRVDLPLLGAHQRLNAALALATVTLLGGHIPVPREAAEEGLRQMRWPGRLQLIEPPGGGRILLDGAHNPAGADSLAKALRQHFVGERPTLILGILRDKDWSHICETLAPLAPRILLVPVRSERSAEPEILADTCRSAHPSANVEIFSSLAKALEASDADPFRLITGSLYLVGEAMEVLRISPTGNEHLLNESTP